MEPRVAYVDSFQEMDHTNIEAHLIDPVRNLGFDIPHTALAEVTHSAARYSGVILYRPILPQGNPEGWNELLATGKPVLFLQDHGLHIQRTFAERNARSNRANVTFAEVPYYVILRSSPVLPEIEEFVRRYSTK